MILKSKNLMITLGLLATGQLQPAYAASLNASVKDGTDKQLENAVVYATPTAGLSPQEQQMDRKNIDQIDKAFVPRISVFQKGTSVEFPNHDNIRHHVYSFSEAKSFEIPLYKGTPADPIVFDKPGAISLGCNIHDWMWAHVYVTDTPYFGISDAQGNVALQDLPPGEYRVQVWHHQQTGSPEESVQTVQVTENETPSLAFQVKKKKQWVPFRAPTQSRGGYR